MKAEHTQEQHAADASRSSALNSMGMRRCNRGQGHDARNDLSGHGGKDSRDSGDPVMSAQAECRHCDRD
eukprot:15455986-Alexandrium_andersonii.AAC.2